MLLHSKVYQLTIGDFVHGAPPQGERFYRASSGRIHHLVAGYTRTEQKVRGSVIMDKWCRSRVQQTRIMSELPKANARTYERTRKALELYAESRPARAKLWDEALDTQGVRKAEHADSKALTELQNAFYEDTKDVNTRSHCACVPASDIERLVARAMDKNAS